MACHFFTKADADTADAAEQHNAEGGVGDVPGYSITI
jgi:hypothetical protein